MLKCCDCNCCQFIMRCELINAELTPPVSFSFFITGVTIRFNLISDSRTGSFLNSSVKFSSLPYSFSYKCCSFFSLSSKHSAGSQPDISRHSSFSAGSVFDMLMLRSLLLFYPNVPSSPDFVQSFLLGSNVYSSSTFDSTASTSNRSFDSFG